ncbi:MAG: hypothetical protein GY856_38060 [bacterium]|nr:hypothetical protein [bacterium]
MDRPAAADPAPLPDFTPATPNLDDVPAESCYDLRREPWETSPADSGKRRRIPLT